jgi:glycosyltransferase involved in cell wall biosynthesis
VTAHDLYFCERTCSEKRLHHKLRRAAVLERAFDAATVVLAVSQFTKERLAVLYAISPEKIHVVGNGVEAGFFDVYEKDPMAVSPFAGETYLLAVGGVTTKKGGCALLNVAEALSKVAPHVKLVVTGPVEAPFLSALQRARNIRSLKRGFADQEMQYLVRGAAALIAISEYEGFGIPVLEAMAAGVPVVAARRAALPEVAGDAGVLVEPTDTIGVAGLLCDVIRDQSWRSELIARGRQRALDFTWDRCVGRLAYALKGAGPKPRCH